MMTRYLLAVLMLLGAARASAQVLVLDVSGARPGTYYYAIVVGSDGRVTAVPLNQTVVPVGGSPVGQAGAIGTPRSGEAPRTAEVPPAAPNVPEAQLQAREQVTRGLVDGKVTTAVGLQRAVSAIANALDAGTVAADAGAALTLEAIALAFERSGDRAFMESSQLIPIITNSQQAGYFSDAKKGCAFLRLVEQGIKDAVQDYAKAKGNAALDAIDWTAVKQIERSVAELIRAQGLQ